ncbi:MAG TPA: MFS transporter [Acidimicrobiales bacterium]|nr:MFS transporter [Acidimicrobiales bacterium]
MTLAPEAPLVEPPDLARVGLITRLRGISLRSSLLPLGILFGLNAVDELDRSAFNVLIPEIQKAFGLNLQGILSLVGVVTFLALGGQVLVGYYADRFSRTRMAIAGAAAWGTFSLLTGLAPIVLILVLARVGSSLGKAVNDPTHNSLLADYYEPPDRVTVFFSHRIANNVGQVLGPVLAGGLALAFGFRAPFILFAIPTFVFVVLAVRHLKEPVRGGHERRAAGGNDAQVATEEAPPTFGEAWRACMQVRSLRRVFYSLPFIAGSLVGVGSLYSLLYEERFGLNELERGLIFGAAEPVQACAAIFIGIPLATRLFLKDPGLILRLLGSLSLIIAAGLAGLALIPTLLGVVPMQMVVSGAGAIVTPGIYAVLSTVLPPRARAMGFGIGALWAMPGALVLLLVGAVGERVGLTGGILMLVPVFLTGALILASGGRFVAEDIERVRLSALAQSETLLSRERGEGALLMCRDVDVSYGQTQVLFGVDFHVDEGEIVALLGTNGAGKSTLLNAICGLVEPGGAIVFDGRDITTLPANATAAAGIVMMPGGKGVFPTLTVAENLELAGWLFQKDPEHVRQATEQVLEYFPILRERSDQRAGNLSGGEQQMLTLGQAFIAKPRLLMIDELTLGLAPVIVEQLLGIVRAIHATGTTIILVEQSVNVAITLAERAVFMEKGEVRFDGPTAELLDRPDVLRAVFLQGAGSIDGPTASTAPAATSVRPRHRFAAVCESCGIEHAPVLEVHEIGINFGGIRAVDDVSFSVREGEILGLIGPNGAGKTTVFDLISGFLTTSTGRVVLGGEDVTELGPDVRAVRGLGRSFQDARLFPSMTVAENLAIAQERHIRTRDPLAAALGSPATKVSERLVRERVDELIELMNLEAFANKFVSELSTGSRRVVDLACTMAHQPKVLLLDEPSSGIAQRETEALGPLLLQMRDRTGAALLLIEHDMPLITGVADRMLALELGRVIASGDPEEVVGDARVIESYLGGDGAVIHRSGAGTTSEVRSSPSRARRTRPLVAGRPDATDGGLR